MRPGATSRGPVGPVDKVTRLKIITHPLKLVPSRRPNGNSNGVFPQRRKPKSAIYGGLNMKNLPTQVQTMVGLGWMWTVLWDPLPPGALLLLLTSMWFTWSSSAHAILEEGICRNYISMLKEETLAECPFLTHVYSRSTGTVIPSTKLDCTFTM